MVNSQLEANILIDRADVILCNLIALSNAEANSINIEICDVIVSLETAVGLLHDAEDLISNTCRRVSFPRQKADVQK